MSISDNEGNKVDLTETSSGWYISSSSTFVGESGKTYRLNIQVEDLTITSTSTIPQLVPIDSISVINSVYPGGGTTVGNQPAPFYEINVHYSDPVNFSNFYRLSYYVKNQTQKVSNVYADNFNNGKKVMQTLIMYNPKLKTGDTICIEMECIDKNE